jgi:lipopolysaccharide export system permease protein
MRNKKLSFLIKPGVFNNSIPNYAMRVERKSESAADSLYGITIYDHTGAGGVAKIIKAEKGSMAKTSDDKFLVLKLINGVRYDESTASGSISYDPRQTLTRMRFRETEVKFDFSSFNGLNRTEEENFKNNAQMLNLKELVRREDTLTKSLDSLNKNTKINISTYYKQNNYLKGYSKIKVSAKKIRTNIVANVPQEQRFIALQSAYDQAQTIQQILTSRVTDYDFQIGEIIRAQIEYQRKFTLAFSCLLLFFIGAPLGAIIRKGGLGLPVVIAIIFFLFYHIISTVAEKSVKEGSLHPVFGMWVAIIVLAPLGVFLTYKATVDSALFDLDYYKQAIIKLFSKKSKSKI